MSMWSTWEEQMESYRVPMWQTDRKIWSFKFLGARRDVTRKHECLKTHRSFVRCLMICVYTRLAKLFCHQRFRKFLYHLWLIFDSSSALSDFWSNMFPGMACSELEFAIRSLGFPVSYDEVQDWRQYHGVFWMPIPWLSVTFHWSQEYQTKDIPGDLYNVS